jgi:hypothetical protein
MPAFYGTRWFIALLTSDCHLTLSWARSIQLMSPHPTSWRVIIVLSFHPHLGLPNGLFLLRFPHPTPVCTSLCLPYVLLALPISCLIWSPEWYLVRNTDHKAPRYVAPLPVTWLLLGANIVLSTLLLTTLSLCSSFNVGVQVLFTVLHILRFTCLDSKLNTKCSAPNDRKTHTHTHTHKFLYIAWLANIFEGASPNCG